jgi:hypothetical protein
MVRDTRWMHPPARPTRATRRAIASIASVLDEPPMGRTSADLLAELEQRRVEVEAGKRLQHELALTMGTPE